VAQQFIWLENKHENHKRIEAAKEEISFIYHKQLSSGVL
jgi:hypothetical protein